MDKTQEKIDKIYSHRIINLKIMAKLLQLVPYIRCVVLNGSMAKGNIKGSSDIDLLIISKQGRIFTCRAAVLFWAHFSGLKRSADETKSHAGRFCFNYFLTDNFLTIPHNRGQKLDQYCAENYSQSKLIWGEQKLFEKYMKENMKWMKVFLPNLRIKELKSRRFRNVGIPISPPHRRVGASENLSPDDSEMSGSRSARLIGGWGHRKAEEQKNNLAIADYKIFQVMRNIIERILSGKFGNWVERFLKKIQIWKIEQNSKTKQYPNLIAFNDKELRFHPPRHD